MSGSRWQWRDVGSNSGHLQRVASNAVYTASQQAYRAYIGHGATCSDCPEGQCQVADDLWQAYQAALGDSER